MIMRKARSTTQRPSGWPTLGLFALKRALKKEEEKATNLLHAAVVLATLEPDNGLETTDAITTRKSAMVSTPPPSQPDEQPLYWLPAGMRLESLPPGLRQAVQELLIPAFRGLVTAAQGPLERLNAVSLVHLAWLELLQQSHTGAGMAGKVPPADQENYAAAFDHHLSSHCHGRIGILNYNSLGFPAAHVMAHRAASSLSSASGAWP